MRAWVCRARFAADRVFAIDRMKKSRHGTRLVRNVNRNSECGQGESLVRSKPDRLRPDQDFALPLRLPFRLPLLRRCVDFRRAIKQGIKDPARQTMTVLFAFELYDRIALGFFPGRRKPRGTRPHVMSRARISRY